MASNDQEYFIRFSNIDNSYLDELSKKRPILTRLCWLLIFLTMFGLCVTIVVELLQDYFQYQSYNLVEISLASSYTLPAMTICNVNLLNATAMDLEEDGVDGRSVLDAYEELISEYGDRSGESSDPDYDYSTLDGVQTKYAMGASILQGLTTFAKSTEDYNNFTTLDYTEGGLCMEMNDNQYLVQKVNGAIGGLSMVLDAQTEHYLPSTQNKGFFITLRMANETVLNKEFGFFVAPGYQYNIHVETQTITRLESPYGSCQDTDDLFENSGILTLKECFLNQKLWMHMKLKEAGCSCWPWYFNRRYLQDLSTKNNKYDEEVKTRLVEYWTETLTDDFKITFDDTCEYFAGIYSGDELTKHTAVVDWESCAQYCRDNTECRYFMYSNATNDIQASQDCQLYSSSTELTIVESNTDTTGLSRGDTQCADIDVCGVSDESKCINLIMDSQMDDVSPPACYEPCNHDAFSYTISSSIFPAPSYWNKHLASQVPQYPLYADATSNLIKLVVYTEQMTTTEVTQTASYDIYNFIAELGGTTDFLVGISLFMIFQLTEWLLTALYKRCRGKGRSINADVEDMSMSPHKSEATVVPEFVNNITKDPDEKNELEDYRFS